MYDICVIELPYNGNSAKNGIGNKYWIINDLKNKQSPSEYYS
jgi:hypothetical protein